MAWMCAPKELIVLTLGKLIAEPMHGTLILPNEVAGWSALLLQLPLVAKWQVWLKPGNYSLGAGVPPDWRADRTVPLWVSLQHVSYAAASTDAVSVPDSFTVHTCRRSTRRSESWTDRCRTFS